MPRSLLLLAAVIVLMPSIAVRAAAETPTGLNVVAMLPRDALNAAQRAAAVAEVARIWNPQGVRVDWIVNTSSTDLAGSIVRIHFVDRIEAPTADNAPPLGAVVRVNGRMRQSIYISGPALVELVQAAGQHRSGPWFDQLLGRVAGRVIAHELGHLLLDSAAHSSSGLMRPRFRRGDVLTTAAAAFALTASERALLDTRRDTGSERLAAAAVAGNGEREGLWRGPWLQ